MTPTSHIEIYESDDGQTQIDVRLEHETLWLSQAQMAELFEKDVRTKNEHLQTIFNEGELDKGATIRRYRTVRLEDFSEVCSTTEESSVVRHCGKLQGRSDVHYYKPRLNELLMKPSRICK